jgi:hypothetical protein
MRSGGEGGRILAYPPLSQKSSLETVRKSMIVTIEVKNIREEGGLLKDTSLGSSGSAVKYRGESRPRCRP